jgi:hypothetical protein
VEKPRRSARCRRRTEAMRKLVTGIALIALVGLALPLAVPGTASAQMREFKGKVDRISNKEVIVDNRMGDKLKFQKLDETTVEGEKQDWKKLKKGEWVLVSWKMMDNPRKAYKVVVLPDQKEEGEEGDE